MSVKAALVAFIIIAIGTMLMMQLFSAFRAYEFGSSLEKAGIYQDENGDYKVGPETSGDVRSGISGNTSGVEDSAPSVNYNRVHVHTKR